MKIRVAEKEDLDEIHDLCVKLFEKEINDFDKTLDKKWSESEGGKDYIVDHIVEKDKFAFVAEDDNKIVGYIIGEISKSAIWRTTGKMTELESMLVLDEYRNQGIGQQLIEKAIEWSRENKVKRITLTASFGNDSAIRFYKRNGFKEYDLVLEKEL